MRNVPNVRRLLERGVRIARHDEGQAYLEMLFVLPLLLVIIAGLLYFGRIFYVGLALDAAAYDGARAAVESLAHGQGTMQGYVAARTTLEGFYVDPGPAVIQIIPRSGGWDRGDEVVVYVRYNTYVGNIPFVRWIKPAGVVPQGAAVRLRVEQFKSRWTNE